MRRALGAGLLSMVILALPGCYPMTIDATDLEPHIYLNSETADDAPPEPVSGFEARTRGSWLFWGLVTLDDPAVSDALAREIRRADGSAVMDVRVVTQRTFVDGLLGVITLGIYGQRTTRIEGTVVR
jgi:hypothetical protein